MQHPEICIAGAGIVGLTLALELHRRGCRVAVLDRGAALAEASTAAAGMLAAGDPENPPALRPLADLSLSLYPAFLEGLHALSSLRVPFQTRTTLQSLPTHTPLSEPALTDADLARLLPTLHPGSLRFTLLDEYSVDPRQLASALLAAVRATAIDLHLHTPIRSINANGSSLDIRAATGSLSAAKFIDCTGAWAASTSARGIAVAPKKGQMLSLSLPLSLPLELAIRTPEVYVVPRTTGPNAGRAIIGATVEDAGFDKTIQPSEIANLRSLATTLLPPLTHASQLEAWAGLRPATPDGLPLLGRFNDLPNQFLATGHYRNGILLAPATALLMAQLITGEPSSLNLAPFSPSRLLPKTT